MSGVYYVSRELYHHGILGMKWGKRNGPPYPLNPEDHSASEKKAGWRKSIDSNSDTIRERKKEPGKITTALAKHYTKQYETQYGDAYSKEAAAKAGMDKATIMKRVAIGAGIVVGVGIASYVGIEYGRKFADDVIRQGATLQTLSVDPGRMKKGLAFYTAFTKSDRDNYMSFFSRDDKGNFKSAIRAIADKKIRLAGTKTGEKVFNRLMSTDSDFSRLVGSVLKKTDWSSVPFAKTDYEKYNVMLVRQEWDAAHRKFYDALSKLGYGGVTDVNDRFNPGIKARAAIIFDRSNIMQKSVDSITRSEYSSATTRHILRVMGKSLFTPSNMVIAGASSIVIANELADKHAKKKYANGEKKE